MIRIREAVVVEGKYDKIRLESLVDAIIVETDGFRIFKDKERLAFLRRLAESRGLLILTDSDGAGFVIRSYLTGVIPPEQIRHAYIPEVLGKEKRKTAPSREGLLGVEGMDTATLERTLRRAGATVEDDSSGGGRQKSPQRFLTKARLYEDGLSGGEDSAERRRRFLRCAGLPEKLSANRLIEAVNAMMTEKEYRSLLEKSNRE